MSRWQKMVKKQKSYWLWTFLFRDWFFFCYSFLLFLVFLFFLFFLFSLFSSNSMAEKIDMKRSYLRCCCCCCVFSLSKTMSPTAIVWVGNYRLCTFALVYLQTIRECMSEREQLLFYLNDWISCYKKKMELTTILVASHLKYIMKVRGTVFFLPLTSFI